MENDDDGLIQGVVAHPCDRDLGDGIGPSPAFGHVVNRPFRRRKMKAGGRNRIVFAVTMMDQA